MKADQGCEQCPRTTHAPRGIAESPNPPGPLNGSFKAALTMLSSK